MRIAYFDCHSGISGDMTLGALLDAGASLDRIRDGIQSLGLVSVQIEAHPTTRKGFRGLLLSIQHPEQHAHRNLNEILSLVRRSAIASQAKAIAMRIFERLAKAEAKVHGTTIDRVHFHEVGAIDSIVDIVGVAIAWDELAIDRACSSPIPVGSGTIKIAHGLVSVPAPATTELLADVPLVACGLPFEMTTPTGAAILAELVTEFGPIPTMQVGRIGYGAGQRDTPDRPNLLRILIGESVDTPVHKHESDESDQIVVLETNLDDVSGEQIGFAIEMAWSHGALDVFTIPIQMKKNRPGTLLTILCRKEEKRIMEQLLVEHTGTLGVRSRRQSRYIVPRAEIEVDSPWGVVRGKVSRLPNDQIDFSPEYDDCSQIARDNGLRLADVISEVTECYFASESQTRPKTRQPTNDLEPTESVSEPDINSQLLQAAFEDIDQFLPRAED
jgi:pyridinium-3,5-bisthiocarboxylic acid mononucleotide nickel chelatase